LAASRRASSLPQTKKILQLLRLRQINNGVFVRVSLCGAAAGSRQPAAASGSSAWRQWQLQWQLSGAAGHE
jgi:hypothetical protein